jgi:hypothetical protein
MKNQPKIALPTITIIENDGTFDFLKGRVLFPEKVAKAKETLKNIKLPPR